MGLLWGGRASWLELRGLESIREKDHERRRLPFSHLHTELNDQYYACSGVLIRRPALGEFGCLCLLTLRYSLTKDGARATLVTPEDTREEREEKEEREF